MVDRRKGPLEDRIFASPQHYKRALSFLRRRRFAQWLERTAFFPAGIDSDWDEPASFIAREELPGVLNGSATCQSVNADTTAPTREVRTPTQYLVGRPL